VKKLVRNKIPSILDKYGIEHHRSLLQEEKLNEAFHDKLHEEWAEFWETPNEEELADCLQVLQDTATLFDIDWEKVKVARAAKADIKGTFSEGIEVTFYDAGHSRR
tara:strand:+ start:29 stop:346 length:318 start_codon:yes stop_codon:yes gene_type:complete